MAEDIFSMSEPRAAARALERRAGSILRRLERVVPEAIRGRAPAVREYIGAWRALERALLEAVREARGGAVAEHDGRLLIVDARGRPSEYLTGLVDDVALQAPFSHWVQRFGTGTGVGLYLLSEIRRAIRARPLALGRVAEMPEPYGDDRERRRFQRLVLDELHKGAPLEEIASTFGLSETELGRLFGVTRQAVGQWAEEGIPPSRLAKVHAVRRIAEVLRMNLKPERIPAVARTAAAAYGNRSLLEAIAAGAENEALDEVRRTFDWAVTA